MENDGFMGAEHFEGMGNVWGAFFGDAKAGTEILPTIVTEGKPLSVVSGNDAGMDVLLLQYPEAGSVRVAALLVTTPENTNWELWSAYPILEGKPTTLTINQRHTWSNGVEGVVAAHMVDVEAPISFFAPFYLRDFANLELDSHKVVHLSALAFSLSQAAPQEYTIDKGGFYEDRLQAFLEENPGKTQADFSPPTVSLNGAKILLPAAYSCEWQFRFPVLAVEVVLFRDIKLYKLTVDFIGYDDDVMSGYLYVSEKILDGYVPLAGHEVEGIMWVTGSLADA